MHQLWNYLLDRLKDTLVTVLWMGILVNLLTSGEWLWTACAALAGLVLLPLVFKIADGRSRRVPAYQLRPPALHSGLLCTLGPYRDRGACPYADEKAVAAAIGKPGFRDNIMLSTWGPLVAAVEHHSAKLTHVFLVCTRGQTGSAADIPVATRVVQSFAPSAACIPVTLPDANDVGCIASLVNNTFAVARSEHGLSAGDIIADMTGGTAAMSAGIAIATLPVDRHLQYLRQDCPLVANGIARTQQELSDAEAIIQVVTNPGLVAPETA